MTEHAIQFENVTKTYMIQQRASPRLGAWIVNKMMEHLRRVPFDALRDVTLDVPRGQMLGILGDNGAGKSTALKLTAGITQPTSGTVRTRGRIASMLELGVGFHPDLSGMENIFYNGIILGLSRAEVLERLERIIAFSGLRDFLYEPVRHYSSGMYARLACSVAMHLDPDIILVDEIMSVGDSEFQHRSLSRLIELHDSGVTVLVVTHVLAAARDVCDRLVWIEHGRVKTDGPAREIAAMYRRTVIDRSLAPTHFLSPERPAAPASTGARPRIVAVRILDENGEQIDAVETAASVRFRFDIDEGPRAETPWRLCLSIRWTSGVRWIEDRSPLLAPGRNASVDYAIPRWPMLRGSFFVDAVLLDGEDRVLDKRCDILRFETITGDALDEGFSSSTPRVEWSVEKAGT